MYKVIFPNDTFETAESLDELIELSKECCNAESYALKIANEEGIQIDNKGYYNFITDYIQDNVFNIIEEYGCKIIKK